MAQQLPSLVLRLDSTALQDIHDSKLGAPMVSRALTIVHARTYDQLT